MAVARTSEQSRRSSAFEVAGFALLAYVPFLLASGQLSSDTKQYLYLDPGRFLERAPYLWDRHVGAGTVSHQHIGYLFPMGPFFWLADTIGLSDRLAQRLWLGTISLLAGLGARWLFRRLGTGRAGAIAGAVVYLLAPYQLAFTARMSVLLLPWAALPWIVGLVIRGTGERSWRVPAALALIVMTVGSVNVSALLLAAVAPILWVIASAWRHRARDLRAVWSFSWRTALLVVGASLWWLNGLRLQGRYGLPVLQLTENVRTVSEFALPNDVLRGLGNWFFYGREPNGDYSVVQATGYAQNRIVILASYAIPSGAIVAAMAIRWRYRAYFAALVVIGTIIGVGAFPYSNPSDVGRVWKSIAERWSIATALRNTPRVGPIIVLGCAALLAAGVRALRDSRPGARLEWTASAAVAVVAAAAFIPVWQHGYFADPFERPGEIPGYWNDLAASLDADDPVTEGTTRVLEIPGSNFALFRWGNTIEPLTPGLADRPYLAREVLPYGTEGTVNLLDAFDRRLQLGSFEPASLAPIARLFASGTIVVRNDLRYERGGTPRPQLVWAALTDPLASGLEPPQGFGTPTRNEPESPLLDPIALRTGALRTGELSTGALDATEQPAKLPPVARFDVQSPNSIVTTAPASQPVVILGDGDGIVDAAAAGIVNGEALVLELAALSDEQLSGALAGGADLVLTDSNRRRYRNFFSSISGTAGPTERIDELLEDPDGYNHRPELFAHDSDDERSVIEQSGGRVNATRDGGSGRPEDRAAMAFDGDVRTSWRVNGADVTGTLIAMQPDEPERLKSVRLVQALNWPRDRVLTDVRVRINDGVPIDVSLGSESLTSRGQAVEFPPQRVDRVEVEIVATSRPPVDPRFANPVGFAEIEVGTALVGETLRLPVSLTKRVGAEASGHALDVVLTRLRLDPGLFNRSDEELAIDRRFELGSARSFALGGTARINPNASDGALDAELGTVTPDASFRASGHLQGDLAARASRAFDGDEHTGWTSRFGPQVGEWIEVTLATGTTFERIDLAVIADGRHQVPTRVGIVIDEVRVATRDLEPIADRARPGASVPVRLTIPPTAGTRIRIVVDAARPASTSPDGYVPIGIAEVRFPGSPRVASVAELDTRCREDLVEIDGAPIGVRLAGDPSGLRSGIAIESCGAVSSLAVGSHTITTARGVDRGVDIDRLVLRSDREGQPAVDVGPRGLSRGEVRTTVSPVDDHGARGARDAVGLRATTDGDPFWLVLNESLSDGWEPSSASAIVGPRTMVNGYANGWLVTPDSPGDFSIRLRWEPQRTVWISLALSGIVVTACIVMLVWPRRRRTLDAADGSSSVIVRAEPANSPALVNVWARYREGRRCPTRLAGMAVLVGAVGVLVSRPWVGALLAATVVSAHLVRATRVVLLVGAPVLVVASRVLDRPEWVWVSLGWLAVDVALTMGDAEPRAIRESALELNGSDPRS